MIFRKDGNLMAAFCFSLSTRIQADENIQPIRRAADILRRDMRAALTESGEENAIRVVIDSSLAPERYRAQVLPQEILLTCGDDLGAAYALLSLSERLLKVKPLGWWMGLLPQRLSQVSVPCQSWESPDYKVRFRCWFVNDEVLFSGWHSEENARAEVWQRVFETVLRCGGNMVIPGTDRGGYDGHVLNEMALSFGLWLTQHHTELLGARMFARVYPDLQPSYTLYPHLFEGLWQEAIDRYVGKRVVWAIGFRGQGDKAFWEDDAAMDTAAKRGAFIARVMQRQMEMVRLKDPNAYFCTNLYGEMMALYRQGHLPVPDGVIKLWGDNGFGKMVSRRQNNDNPRTDAMPGENETGENGIYYHVSFYDLQAANHITPLQNPPQMIADELKTILEKNANALWNINVGSIYPHAFMLDLVARMWRDGVYDDQAAAKDFASLYYSPAAAPLMTAYGDSAVHYGPNPDDRAGDQYYHWPLRALAHALLRGETEKPVDSLRWAAGEAPFLDQAKHVAQLVKPGIASWRKYLRACERVMDEMQAGDEAAACRLRDREYLYGLIHETGCEGLYAFCQACAHSMAGNDLQAYLWADRALECHRGALRAMNAVQGRFAFIYRNDCFSGVAVTVRVLETVRGWLRMRGDGEYLFKWEKQFLVPREEAIMSLQSHRTAQLSDDELCLRLRGEIPLKEAF